MTGAFSSLDGNRPSHDGVKLPIFDRRGWKRTPFGAFADSINERVKPIDAAEGIYAPFLNPISALRQMDSAMRKKENGF